MGAACQENMFSVSLVLAAAVVSVCGHRLAPAPLPLLRAHGSHYQLGLQIGSMFRNEIHIAMVNNTFFRERMLPYNRTQAGAVLYGSYLNSSMAVFPQYVEEIQGMADGAGLTFSELFLWNIHFEWSLLLDEKPVPSCSDLFLVNGKKTVVAHNEDGDAIDMHTSYLVEAVVTGPKGLDDNFTAFCYPGELCGKAFGYNALGKTIISANAVFPKDVNHLNMARNFINRAVLSLPFAEVGAMLRKVACSSGFSLNVLDLGPPSKGTRVTNFEVSPTGVVETPITGYGYHFNMYMHSAPPQRADPSSEHRLARVRELPQPSDLHGLLGVLGDTLDKDYPIYRTPRKSDPVATLCTAAVDISRNVFMVYTGNPAVIAQPAFSMPLW